MKKSFFLIAVSAMVAIFSSCEKEDLDNLTKTVVQRNPGDTVVLHDTTSLPGDTVIIHDSIPGAPGMSSHRSTVVVFRHLSYGQWQGNGATRSITAVHQVKVVTHDSTTGVVTRDSATFIETGTMTVLFQPSYSGSQDGTHTIANGDTCPDLQASVKVNWWYGSAICGGVDYSNYFVGNCELVPTVVTVNGTNAIVTTTNGHETRTAPYTIVVNQPTPPSKPTIVYRTAVLRHNTYGQWTGTGATRTITANHWLVELAHWSDSTVTREDSVLINETGTMTWSFPTYTTSQDGNYTATSTGCTSLNATCSVKWSYDPFVINGRTYNFNGDCSLKPTKVSVSGTTATVTTAHGSTTRDAAYGITIKQPAPEKKDTINIFGGKLLYYAITASYRNSAQSSSDVDWFLCVVTLDSSKYKVYYSPLASTAKGLSFTFKGTITSTEYSNLVSASNFTAAAESGLRCGLAMAYHHNDNSILDITDVKLSAKTGQVKYYYLANASLHSAHSAIGQTIGNVKSAEPVREGGVKSGTGEFNFVYNGTVVR